MSKGGRFEKKKQRSSKKIALIVACVVAASVLGMVAFAATYVNGMLNDVNYVEVASVVEEQPISMAAKLEPVAQEAAVVTVAEETTKVENIAKAEIAAKAEKPAEKGELMNFLIVGKPIWEDGKRLTKTLLLCTLDTGSKAVTLTPLQENALVEAPAYKNYAGGQVTLGSVYAMGSAYGNGTAGSMEFMNKTLYKNFGIEVDKNFEMDMQVLARIVTRLGFVKIELTEAEAAYLSEAMKKEVKSGEQEMNGTMAREFIKMWADEEAEGIDSLIGQKKIFNGILQKIRSEYIMSLEPIARETMPSITTSMTQSEFEYFMISMVPMLRKMNFESGDACPAEFEAQMMDLDGDGTEEEVLTFNAEQVTKVMRALTEGEQE